MTEKVPEICKICSLREEVKSLRHSNARYKQLQNKKTFRFNKIKFEMRLTKNHLKQMTKKLEGIIKRISKYDKRVLP